MDARQWRGPASLEQPGLPAAALPSLPPVPVPTRSKDIEASGFNGTAAFMEVRVQSIVVEFILTHVEQLFGDAPLCSESCQAWSLAWVLSPWSAQPRSLYTWV